MRILLINPAGWQKESVNLGLSYLASSLLAAGYEALILDLNRYEMDEASLLDHARKFNPRLIGISIKTATAREGGRLAKLLKDFLPETVVVAGGPHMTLCPEAYMRDHEAVSFGIMGEGEESLVNLVKVVCQGGAVNKLPGVVWRQDGQIVVNAWAPPEKLNSIAFPNLDVIQSFSWQDFRYPILTSRGCPFECIYCCVNKLTGSKKWRFRTPENVIEELERLVRTKGITAFEIWDDNFTLDLKRAKKICQLLMDRKLNLSWYCHNGIRADRIDGELARMMKAAGCTSIALGLESGNPATFDSIKKGEPLSALIQAVRLIKQAGIKAVGYFIIGLPGDTLGRFIETVRFQRALDLDHYVFGMLIPYPHTKVWEMVRHRGKMFCDITETQHFSDDMVPIAFELPGFPKNDMIRAFYIAKYFDLFAAVRQIAKSRNPTVIYVGSSEMIKHLPGMFIACDPWVRHVVVGPEEADIRALTSFAQVPETLALSFVKSIPSEISFRDTVIVSPHSQNPGEPSFHNAGLVSFDPQRPLRLVTLVRPPEAESPGIPKSVRDGDGMGRIFSKISAVFGVRK